MASENVSDVKPLVDGQQDHLHLRFRAPPALLEVAHHGAEPLDFPGSGGETLQEVAILEGEPLDLALDAHEFAFPRRVLAGEAIRHQGPPLS